MKRVIKSSKQLSRETNNVSKIYVKDIKVGDRFVSTRAAVDEYLPHKTFTVMSIDDIGKNELSITIKDDEGHSDNIIREPSDVIGFSLTKKLSEDNAEVFKTAVGILYDMNRFVLDVYDHAGWLMGGVPDGEFNESTRQEAENNYESHRWLVEDLDGSNNPSFSVSDFKDFADTFMRCTKNETDYDANGRASIHKEAQELITKCSKSVNASTTLFLDDPLYDVEYVDGTFYVYDNEDGREVYQASSVESLEAWNSRLGKTWRETYPESVNSATEVDVKVSKNGKTIENTTMSVSIFNEDTGYCKEVEEYIKDKYGVGKVQYTISKVSSSVNAANYGGAYDIDPQEYFTNDDILSFGEYVCESINEIFYDTYSLTNIKLANHRRLLVELTRDSDQYEYQCVIEIDMRKIKKPSDLLDKYSGEVIFSLRQEIEKDDKLTLEYNTDEEDSSGNSLHDELYNATVKHLSDVLSMTEKEADDYMVVVVNSAGGRTHVEVRAELSYRGLEKLMNVLDPIVQKYDPDSYFEPVEPGIIEAYLDVDEAVISSTNIDGDEFETDQRWYVYDESDNCVSDEFHSEDDAIEWAKENEYPTVKVHRYYIENDKHYPDGDPEIVWPASQGESTVRWVQRDLHAEDELKYSGSSGRSWVGKDYPNIDIWNSKEEAIENGKRTFKKNYKYGRDWDVVNLDEVE